jgi:hypothetical protein
LLTIVAAFTRSAREAQAWLSITQLVPTLPLVFAAMFNLRAEARADGGAVASASISSSSGCSGPRRSSRVSWRCRSAHAAARRGAVVRRVAAVRRERLLG